MAKRALPYKDDFLKFGFTEIKDRSGLVRPQCVFCLQVLSNESMKENKLKRHLNTVHPTLINKPLEFWKEHKNKIKRMRLDCPSNTLTVSLQKTTKASFDVAWKIARSKKEHNIGEELIKPAAISMVRTVCGDDIANKLELIPLSDNTVKRRIDLMSENILKQLVHQVIAANKFSIQIDESVDIQNNAQLMVFIRYRSSDDFREDFLFCEPLLTTATGLDIFNKVDGFFRKNNLAWCNCVGICSDGAPAMLGNRIGFCKRVQELNSNVVIIHCFLHRENLATRTIQPEFFSVLQDVIQIVNFIKSRALNSRIFHAMCDEMGSQYVNLLYHSDVRWLSRGKILTRVMSLRL